MSPSGTWRGDRPRGSYGEPITGRLQAHAAAPYQFRAGEELSYYVRLLTSRGVRTLWGKDLERAIARSQTQPKIGELVGVQRLSREAVTVLERTRDREGRIVTETQQLAHRSRWRVETVQWFAERARLARRVRDAHADASAEVRAHPELKSVFLSARAGEEFAARRIADPKDREIFLARLREAMAGSIRQGEPLPDVRLRDRPAPTPTERSPPTRSTSARPATERAPSATSEPDKDRTR